MLLIKLIEKISSIAFLQVVLGDIHLVCLILAQKVTFWALKSMSSVQYDDADDFLQR